VPVDEVVEQTGFPLVVDDPPVTREPTAEEMAIIRESNPGW
jgi:hypothetical protein